MKKYIKFAGILFLSLFATHHLFAQNIVTIFGQEKIEKTDEGTVFHNFEQGLLLPGEVNPGTLFNGQDMIAWLYATGQFVTPKANNALTHLYPNITAEVPFKRWQWSEIKVDSAGVFKDRVMRSAYLYTSYNSPREQTVLLETTGGTRVYINGFPHEGDHYDFGYTLIPVKLKKGLNEIIHTPGRFGRVAAKLVTPDNAVMFTKRDMTNPDIIIGENDDKWAAIRVINANDKALKGLSIRATLSSGERAEYKTSEVMPLSVRKVSYKLPAVKSTEPGKLTAKLELLDAKGKVIDQTEVELRQVLPSVHHERTFISRIDGSVQYYSVAPAIRNNTGETKALVLSVHGAGVEARNQARAYKSKDWTDVVAATNRRPYGFNWEEWGRIDGLEVLEEAKRVFRPDLSKIYLTGHSMGGHGTWILGTTYPDKFAAIAPCAGYPDISTYGRGRSDEMHRNKPSFDAFERAANGGRTLALVENLKQSGVYIFHGDSDSVVSPNQARLMRAKLGTFHPDFCYEEYPGGEHWFGDLSVDWGPIFNYFSRHAIPAKKEVKSVDFYTASPGISSTDYWVTVEQQTSAYVISNIKAAYVNDTIRITKADNIALLTLDIPSLEIASAQVTVEIGEQQISVPNNKKAVLKLDNNKWIVADGINTKHKYPARYGGFKYAFNNNVVFVYATKGNAKENEWYRNKARFDAETFYYRGNGSIDVIPDAEYTLAKYANRNVIIYGNKDNNSAWALLLKNCPVQVSANKVVVGLKEYQGNDLGTYFTYPHPESETASVGVVAGTGDSGMRATSPNNYISGITGFPDLMVFRADVLKNGLDAMELASYFDADWLLSKQDFK